MSKKTKKGYLWVFDQQDKWENITSDKMSQLEEAKAAHLSWFDTHATVSELLALRKPDSKRRRESTTEAETGAAVGQAAPIANTPYVAEDSAENINNENELQAVDMERALDVQKVAPDIQENAIDEPVQEAHEPAEDRMEEEDVAGPAHNQAEESLNPQNDKTSGKANAAETQAESVDKIDSVTASSPTPEPGSSAELNQDTTKDIQEEQPFIHSILDDFDEQEDEIQVVVSARNRITEAKDTTNPASYSPLQTFPLSHSKTSTLIHNSTTTTTRHRSAFMDKLFKLTRPSLKKAALPTPSPSTSCTANKNDSHSNHPNIITKRPSSTSSVVSSSSYKSALPIQTSDIVPEPRFKRPSTLQKLVEHDLSTVEEVNEPSETRNPAEEDTSFEIPAWARDPLGLENQLRMQSKMDPDTIFGRLPPLDLRGKCSRIRLNYNALLTLSVCFHRHLFLLYMRKPYTQLR
ncbi:hypothetical protein [Parasitella parasitica]|uniref:Inner centromere protein ARK-binding domain-containing protein n=1 Tax=Parasitella parasitica TaxID=35722 RepID=A0A0B7NWN1_9FUNG|nr:hypothetical protein [Parasitella parasitica]